jgi:hypothetical protein
MGVTWQVQHVQAGQAAVEATTHCVLHGRGLQRRGGACALAGVVRSLQGVNPCILTQNIHAIVLRALKVGLPARAGGHLELCVLDLVNADDSRLCGVVRVVSGGQN